MGDQWGLNPLIMSSSLSPLLMSEMKDRELLHFGSSVSPQVAPIQENALTGCLAAFYPHLHQHKKYQWFWYQSLFLLQKENQTAWLNLEDWTSSSIWIKKDKKKRESSWCKSCFCICALHFDSSGSRYPSEHDLRKIASMSCVL